MQHLLEIAAGVSLMLFGVRFLRKGLIRWAGPSFDARLASMMSSRRGSIMAGLVFGILAPSSTTQSILAANLVKNRRISPENILSFLLWANLGITVTVQLISIRVGALYPLPLVLGTTLFMFGKTRVPKALGQCALAFGLVFLAMSLVGAASSSMMSDGDLSRIAEILTRHPGALFVFAAALAFALQSSMAVLGVFFAASYSGALGLAPLLAVVLGATVGIGITTMVTCWTLPPPAPRLAASSLILKLSVCLPVLLVLPSVASALSVVPLPPTSQSALFHAALNLSVALLATIVGPSLRTFYGPKPTPATPSPLDYSVLAIPELALACASRETIKLGESVREMYEAAWHPSPELHSRLHRVEEAEDEISAYVSRMDWSSMSPAQREIAFGILNFVSHLSVVSDMVCTRLGPCIAALETTSGQTDSVALEDLRLTREMVARRLDMSTAVLASRDPEVARAFLELGSAVKRETITALKRQYERGSHPQHPGTPSPYDAVAILRRISGQLNTIGHTFYTSLLESADSSTDRP